MHLRRAVAEDVAFVMATERGEGYDALVGRWDTAQHRAALADGQHVVMIGSEAAQPVGFVILRGWNASNHVTYIQRVAVMTPGQGDGRRMLRAVLDLTFRDTHAHRVWLGVFPDNLRAQRMYAAVGFRVEGISRGSAFFGGVHRDEVTMAVLRPEWIAGLAGCAILSADTSGGEGDGRRRT